ncbi:PREDICTED: uncharacterized protein LOC109220255 [Nicotiana attenuata]|uniref:uncharacterized protein LOC109220255 n=1 Tax=Nicotiana attenuata TaxID=49451 RepID=UPI000904F278|nr:PREDICTED: uncharacterized protein LOC109220255 [Nicotiana attenuata]
MAIEDQHIGATSTTGNFTAGTATFPTIDHNHPLYLQPTDTPSNSLIFLQLTGSDNYALRSRAMRIGLPGKSKLGFVDGRFPKSKFEPELHDLWEKVNAIVLSWIMNGVRPGLLSSVLYASSAHRVWKDLKERFDQVNGSRILYLHREVHTLTQGTMTITDYFSRLRELWDEFDALMPCPDCPCPESKQYAQHFEYQRLFQFFTGLNESYSQSRSRFMMMSPLPSINKDYSLLVDQESQGNLTSTTQVAQVTETLENIALYSSSSVNNTGNNKSKRNQVQCEYCHYKGHTKKNCYKVIGYPTDFKAKRKGISTGQYANYVGNAEISGAERCNMTANMTPTLNGSSSSVTTQQMSQPAPFQQMPHPAPFFTHEQYQQIVQLLSRGSSEGLDSPNKVVTVGILNHVNAFMSQCVNSKWIVDTGASNHMTSSLDMLHTHRPLPNTEANKVHLPTGNVVSVSHTGCTSVLSNQEISNILYIPDFKFNLLSVSKLTKELKCMVGFFPDFFIFQDLFSGQVKGMGREEHGLYILQGVAKQTKLPFQLSSTTTKSVFELIHCDIWGPYRVPTHDGKIYFVTIVDDHTRFWGECVATTVYLLNRLPSKVVGYKSPLEMLYLHPPSLSHLRVFGCICYATCPQVLDKFSPRAILAMFLGYSSSQKGYLLYTMHSKTFIVNRNVMFQENIFPFKHATSIGSPVFPILDLLSSTLSNVTPSSSAPPAPEVSIDTTLNQFPANSSQRVPHSTTSSEDSISMIPSAVDQFPDVTQNPHVFPQQADEPPAEHRRSSRPSKPPLWLQDYVTTSKGSKCTYPISSYMYYSSIALSYKQVLAAYSALSESTSFKEAAADPKWIAAMKLEIASLEDNHTWSIVDLPPGKTPIGCRWVYRIKYKASGEVERFKARLVAKGYSQKEGLDYGETFSHMAKIVTVRSVIALAA